MDCPKCGQTVMAGAVECGACGIILSRYSDRRERWVPPPPPPPEPKKDSGNNVLVVFGLFVLALVGVAVYMKKSGVKLPLWVEDTGIAILAGVLIVGVVIYKFMVVKSARL